ncbi:TadE/TadG family type IV pilus assembly protein [Rhizobium paknamense]|uniref:Flp pilus assembly protein TadG n=1 Tax=Rhizobium paknamense TaxID=1206817 RepID=A0ABU0IA67_9HYPH|nr:pilus assembly protein [Rhizobium paknamense]MDQ0455133.1 Flp pilus assembly protein TadG [Rhizobium paknamense]
MRFHPLFLRLLRDRSGNFGMISAFLMVPLLLAVGVAIDLSRAYNSKINAQTAADSAVLAASAAYSRSTSLSTIADQIDVYLKANGGSSLTRVSGPTINSAGNELCVTVQQSVETTFMQIASINSVPVTAQSCSSIGQQDLEVSLVLDVSSSMIEQGRFAPMQQAVLSFLKSFSNNTAAAEHARIAIVPFSSRVNIGMARTSWLRAYESNAAVPSRWKNMSSYYSDSKYTLSTWVDGVTRYAYTSKPNYYWAGCIEPRADVEMYEKGSYTSLSTNDAPPSTLGFVAMDDNPGAKGQFSYCPPPMIGLTNDFTGLQTAVSKLTSEGSTRLDAGVVAGWYSLSPQWRTAWGGTAPQDYSNSLRKVIIFMTDGEMNTKWGENGDSTKLDWLCVNNQSDSCDSKATEIFLATCQNIKSAGIEIFTISYSSDADVTNLKKCSSGTSYAYSASTTNIQTVYENLAANLVSGWARLTQ